MINVSGYCRTTVEMWCYGATVLDVYWTIVIGGVCPMYWLWLVSLLFIFFCFISLSLLIVNCLKNKCLYSKSKFWDPYIVLSISVCHHSASVTLNYLVTYASRCFAQANKRICRTMPAMLFAYRFHERLILSHNQ